MKPNSIVFFLLFAFFSFTVFAADDVRVVERPLAGVSVNYPGNMAPLQNGSLIKLPFGAIHPKGWLRKYMELQRDGLTGQLGTISAWLDKNNNQWLSGEGSHGWEEVPYWLKGYASLSYMLEDEEMLRETKFWIDAVIDNAQASGFFGPSNYDNGRLEIWAQMIMLWVLQDYYEYSGDERVIGLMKRYINWEKRRPADQLLKGYWENSRGGDNMWSAVWLYNRTGYDACLEVIEKLHGVTADWHQALDLPNWHGVNFAQGYREPATYYLLTGDEEMLRASYNTFNIMHDRYGQMPGGMFAADENARWGYEDPRQGAETCAMVEHMASDEIMLEITGDPFWADHCEDVAFNTLPAAFTENFRALRYLVCPNMAVSDARNHNPSIDNSGPFLALNPFSSRCCQHNHGQGWPYFAQHIIMATYDNGLAAMLYAPGEVEALVADQKKVKICEETHYPFEGNIALNMEMDESVLFPLYLRIPAWADGAVVKINGEKADVKAVAGQYVCIERQWQNGDRVELAMPMNLRLRTWASNNNSMSIDYGPLTLSLKIAENYVERDSKDPAFSMGDSQWQAGVDASLWPTYELFADSPWNYALAVTTKKELAQFEIIHKDWPEDDFPFSLQNVPLEFKTQGKLIPSWGFDDTGMTATLPSASTGKGGTEEITLVPMGAARLRIAAFPRYIDRAASPAGIDEVWLDGQSGIYDLFGRRYESFPHSGIFVKNGKKIVWQEGK